MTVLQRMTAFVRSMLAQAPRPDEMVDHGVSYASGTTTGPSYDPAAAMSAMAAFPWVYSAMQAITTDLGSVPYVLVRKGRGGRSETLREHPVLDLLNSPNSRTSPALWHAQRVVDFLLTGNAYTLMVGGARPVSLIRLHPEYITVEPERGGGVRSYLFETGDVRVAYAAQDVLHLRGVSYEADAHGLYGTGRIRPLHAGLTTEARAEALAGAQSKTGRPSAIIMASDPGQKLSDEQRKRIAENYERLSAQGGALVVDRALQITHPSWTPRDMEFAQTRERARQDVLAVFGMVPTRLGLQSANYATAQQEAKTYWQNLVGLAKLIDQSDARLVAAFEPGAYLTRDFSRIDALQGARTEAMGRIAQWVMLGADPAKAAAYEGMEGSPLEGVTLAPPPAEPARADGLASVLFGKSERAVKAADAWATLSAIVERKQKQSRLNVARAANAAFEAQRARITEALMALAPPEERHIRTAVPIDALVSAAEKALPADDFAAMGPWLKAALERAYKGAKRGAGSKVVLASSGMVDQAVKAQMGDLVAKLNATTSKAVKATLQSAVDQGLSLSEITAQLAGMPEFSPARALAVARNEVGKIYSAGTDMAYKALADEGIRVKKEWLAREGARPAHSAMNGQVVEVDESFTSPDGHKAKHPGGFGVASLDINCTCVERVVVLEDE